MRSANLCVLAVVFLTGLSPVVSQASFRHRRSCVGCQPTAGQTMPQGAASGGFFTALLPFLSFAQPVIQSVIERKVLGGSFDLPASCDVRNTSSISEDPKITATRNELAEIQKKLGLPVTGTVTTPIDPKPVGNPPQPTEPTFFPGS